MQNGHHTLKRQETDGVRGGFGVLGQKWDTDLTWPTDPPIMHFTMVIASATKRTKRTGGRVASKRPLRTYASALKYLFSQTDYEQMLRVRYNSDTFSLDRMKKLLRYLGNPQNKLRTVHIPE